jgi:hypothetical protein
LLESFEVKLDWRSPMNIKSLLIGSAAALASATVVNAADAIVAAEPEPLEYVRVCDAFGAGYFYIPGTETCLKIGGYARFEVGFGNSIKGRSDWNASSRGQVNFDARSETELGVLRSFIDLRFNADNAQAPAGGILQQGFIELGGFRAGKFDNWWDSSLSGETDVLNNKANFNSVRYTFNAGAWSLGVAVDELEGTGPFAEALNVGAVAVTKTYNDNNIGISSNLGIKLDGVSFDLTGGYDTDLGEGAIRAMLTAQLGPGALGLAGVYASGANAYFAASEWVVAAEYAVAINDRLKITPGVQWYGNLSGSAVVPNVAPATGSTTYTVTNHWSNNDAWKAGLTVDYKITNGLTTKITANYYDPDGANNDTWTGFIRLDRSF